MADVEPKKKVPKLLEDGLSLEMKPADMRSYLDRALAVMVDGMEQASDPHTKKMYLVGILAYYHEIALKDFSDETVNKMARTQDKTLDEVRRLRKKSWEQDDDTLADGEE